VNTLNVEQGRIRENLKAFDAKSEEAGEFRASLKKSESEIKDLSDNKIPALMSEKERVQKSLDAAKMKLTLTWASA
jgi:hypothetical protein